MRAPAARILTLSLVVLLPPVVTSAEAPTVRILKNLKFTRVEVPGARITEVRGLNNLGQVVGAWEDPTTRRGSGFLLSEGVYTSIDIPGAVGTSAYDINDAGDIVGAYSVPAGPGQSFGDTHGFLLTAGGELTTITAPGQRVTQAFGINNQRQIVGSYTEVVGDQVLAVHGFLLENGVFTPIDFPVPTPRAHILVTFVTKINDVGDIVGGYNGDDIFETRHGFILHDGIYSTFDVPRSEFTDLFGINNAGYIVGEYLQSGEVAGFLFSPKRGFFRLIDADNPKQIFRGLFAFDINDFNQIVGDGSTVEGLRGFEATLPGGW